MKSTSASVSISKAAELLGVSIPTMRRWESDGLIKCSRTAKGHRRYDPDDLPCVIGKTPVKRADAKTYAYARVSTARQAEDLERQKRALEMFCCARGWRHEIVSDIGSGLNYNKRGLQKLIDEIMSGKVERLVIAHKDRLLRFGAELVFSLCAAKGCEVVIIGSEAQPSFEEELARDVLEIITVFSAKLYGRRSKKTKRLIEMVEKALAEESSDER